MASKAEAYLADLLAEMDALRKELAAERELRQRWGREREVLATDVFAFLNILDNHGVPTEDTDGTPLSIRERIVMAAYAYGKLGQIADDYYHDRHAIFARQALDRVKESA